MTDEEIRKAACSVNDAQPWGPKCSHLGYLWHDTFAAIFRAGMAAGRAEEAKMHSSDPFSDELWRL
jgi:hypothetical protein